MSDVQFDEDNADLSYRQNFYTEKKSKIFRLIESFGVPEEYVNYVLIGILVLVIFLSTVLIHNSVVVHKAKPTTLPLNYTTYHNKINESDQY